MSFNPYRKPWNSAQPNKQAGKGFIEEPGDAYFNMQWQTRESEPTEYHLQVAATLAELFDDGKHDLDDIVAGLQSSSVRIPTGEPWTEASFRAEMARLSK